MRFTVTPLGGAGQTMSAVVAAVVRYVRDPRTRVHPSPTVAVVPGGSAGPERYYADAGDRAGRWQGRGAAALSLDGDVNEVDLGKVLGGRDPATGERLVSARGSAGRRPSVGAGSHTRLGQDSIRLYGTEDAAAVLGLPVAETAALIDAGARPAAVSSQPAGSYLVPVRVDDALLVAEAELARCLDAREAGTTAEQAAVTGSLDDVLPLAEAARIAAVTARYLRRLAKRYETDRVTIGSALTAGRTPRQAYLVAQRGADDRWLVRRGELVEFLRRRRPPAVRVGFDLTLTTEKSLGVLALLSPGTVREAVLGAIQGGNDTALAWMEQHSAAARHRGRAVPVRGWTVASFEHHTSRALDPFPHHHNVVANTVEDHHGVRRTLDARNLYRDAKAASALATSEMRHRMATTLGVRWRRGTSAWEVAGVPDEVLREFSRRRSEIEEALRDLEDALGRGSTLHEVDRVILGTRPAKASATVEELLASWWHRAQALGFGPDDLAATVAEGYAPGRPDPTAVVAALAAPDGICQNLSVFSRGDVLAALVDLDHPDDAGQPLALPASELEQLADAFLGSTEVVRVTAASETVPARYSTGEMLAVQDRIVRRYRRGLHHGAALAGEPAVGEALHQAPHLTAEQQRLVRSFTTSGHRIQCAVGRPGAGKTTAMAAARHAWETAGYRVLGAAVKGEAARTLAAATGIRSETLAWYLAHDDPLTAAIDARTVLVVDEASTVSDRDLDRLGWLAHTTGATLRLIGDPAQHGAVEAGGMFRVLCERHPAHTPELTRTHRLEHPLDRAAADALRDGDVTAALDHLDAAGHLHVVEDELGAYKDVLTRWWSAHLAGDHHPMVDRRNTVRRALNRLAHTLRQTNGELGTDHLVAADGRRFATGDRVIARAPDRHLHPPDDRAAYVRNGATGTVTAIHTTAQRPEDDTLTIAFDDIATIDIPRAFVDTGARADGQPSPGLDHAYAVTSWAVQGATNAVSTSRIDETSTRAETYVDITRGRSANHLYLTRHADPLDGEHLPRIPPEPVDIAVASRLTSSTGERTAWELLHPDPDHRPAAATAGRTL